MGEVGDLGDDHVDGNVDDSNHDDGVGVLVDGQFDSDYHDVAVLGNDDDGVRDHDAGANCEVGDDVGGGIDDICADHIGDDADVKDYDVADDRGDLDKLC